MKRTPPATADGSRPSIPQGEECVPDIVVCGVRKCGTTSLFQWLGDHPDVCPSSTKETRFLMDADSPYRHPEHNVGSEGLEGYGRFFAHRAGERFTVEATSRYYDQQTALETLSQLKNPPHAVFVLRDPVQRLISAFRYAQNNRGTIREDVTLEQFFRAQQAGDIADVLAVRADGRENADVANEVSQLPKELDYGNYAARLRPWRDAYPEGRLHVVLFEDLAARPRKFMQRLAPRLGVDPAFFEDYEFNRANRTVPIKNHALHRIVRRLAPMVPRTSWTRSLYRGYLGFQDRRHTSAEADDTLGALRGYYRESNRELAAMFGLDLRAWS